MAYLFQLLERSGMLDPFFFFSFSYLPFGYVRLFFIWYDRWVWMDGWIPGCRLMDDGLGGWGGWMDR